MPSTFEICDWSQHPEYARLVGEIVSLWSMIELRLSIIFGQLLRAPPWTAWEAFFTIFNAKARVDMMRETALALDEKLPERSELIDLIDVSGALPPHVMNMRIVLGFWKVENSTKWICRQFRWKNRVNIGSRQSSLMLTIGTF
jgi:hypothetical protein